MRTLPVAVVGLGRMGGHHARIYQEIPVTELAAVADPSELSRRPWLGSGVNAYASLTELLKEEQVSAVSIASPTTSHVALALEALEAGCHVLVEKPIADNPRSARNLVEFAQRQGRILTTGHVERYNAIVSATKKLISGGAIGEVSSIVATRVGGFPPLEPPTDVVLDLAIHDLDICSHLLGERLVLLAAHGSRTHHKTWSDSAEILLAASHASCFVQANWVTPVKIRRLVITGSAGHLAMNYITQDIELFEHSSCWTGTGFEDFVRTFGLNSRRTISIQRQEPLRRQLETFAQVAMGVWDPVELAPVEDAIVALELALEAGSWIEDRLMIPEATTHRRPSLPVTPVVTS
jgi:UDP-N-acetylglucosamine 3-dehydrogenase